MIKITKACTAAFMKARNSFVKQCREKHINLKKQETVKIFYKALSNRFWLTSKSYSWFTKVVHGRPSIKWTSWKVKWYFIKYRLDVEKEEGHGENY